MSVSNIQINASTDVNNYQYPDAFSSEANNIINLDHTVTSEATNLQHSYLNGSHLESMQKAYDLLGEWGFQSCQQTFWGMLIITQSSVKTVRTLWFIYVFNR